MRTVQQVISRLASPQLRTLVAPKYTPNVNTNKAAMAIEAMKRHMTDEGWQIMNGLSQHGYDLCGFGLDIGYTNTSKILEVTNPGTVVIQDKREWDPESTFTNLESLKQRDDIFTLTILKDTHQRPVYHQESAREIGCNAWIVYYHPRIAKHMAPYVRSEHLIRTHHSLDPATLPQPNKDRSGSIISGAALSRVYPLRSNIINNHKSLPQLIHLRHPGYHRRGCQTRKYYKILNRFKVSICTSSIYGYALHKIVEATACGCRVITDLPSDDILPEIDDNLIRIDPDCSTPKLKKLLTRLYEEYNYDLQMEQARKALAFYNYSSVCKRLAEDIETLKRNY